MPLEIAPGGSRKAPKTLMSLKRELDKETNQKALFTARRQRLYDAAIKGTEHLMAEVDNLVLAAYLAGINLSTADEFWPEDRTGTVTYRGATVKCPPVETSVGDAVTKAILWCKAQGTRL